MNPKESVAAYCKAQAEINNIEKLNEHEKKLLNERIKTCRSIITDELVQKKISCFEFYDADAAEPLYFRLKPTNTNFSITMEQVKIALKHIDRQILNTFAEKHENHFPKMVSASIQNIVKNELKEKSTANERTSLQVSTNRERGYQREMNENVSDEIAKVARDFLGAKKELACLKNKTTEQKKQPTTIQKEVENTVKDALKQTDPKNMTTKVHMMQQDNEWIYYLRCKEKEKAVPVGMRKIIQIVETAVSNILDERGLPREYSMNLPINDDFWNSLSVKISKMFDIESQEKKVVSKLSLDRGAPRRTRKKDDT